MPQTAPAILIEELQKSLSYDYMTGNFGQIVTVTGVEIERDYAELLDVELVKKRVYLLVKDLHYDIDSVPLHIGGTNVRRDIVFVNCTFSGINMTKSIHSTIVFYNCQVFKTLVIDDVKMKHLNIKKCSFYTVFIVKSEIDKIASKDSVSIRHMLYFGESKISKFDFLGNCLTTKIFSKGTSFSDFILIGVCQTIIFTKQSLVNFLDLSNAFFDNRLHCHHVLVADNSEVKDVVMRSFNLCGLILCRGTIVSQLKLENLTIGYLFLSQTKIQQAQLHLVKSRAHFEDVTVVSLKSTNCSLEVIKCTGEIAGKFYFDQGIISELLFTQSALTKDGMFSIASSEINKISFDQLLVAGLFQFKEIRASNTVDRLLLGDKVLPFTDMDGISSIAKLGIPDMDWGMIQLTKNGNLSIGQRTANVAPEFIISRSSLGKTEFIGCDLSSFQLLYRNSKLLDVFFAGTRLPKDDHKVGVSAIADDGKLVLELYEQKISIYSQLKKIFDSQGNIIEGNMFHAWAMYYQQKLLTYRLKTAWKTWQGLDMICDWLAFRLNRLSNNHGESWGRALLFTMIATLLFFVLSASSLKYHFTPANIFNSKGWQWVVDWSPFWSNREKIPAFFLPTHKMDLLVEGTIYKPGFWHYCWDVAGRIFIGYGIYQFIGAFRRHNRKSA